MDRARAAAIGRDTLAILEAGELELEGQRRSLRREIDSAVAGTIHYSPDAAVTWTVATRVNTVVEVANETTIAALRRLVRARHEPAALNFASAKNPGGGFLSGARAQEESLARSSALYACLKDSPMYSFHRARNDPMYTSYCIHSPSVPVFRDDDGELMEPVPCAFITCAAVNAKVVLKRNSSRRAEIEDRMRARVQRVLAVAAAHEHRTLILGAWGCGVFGNEPASVAELFHAQLTGEFAGAFAHVVFAIVDWSPEERFLKPFRTRFSDFASGPA